MVKRFFYMISALAWIILFFIITAVPVILIDLFYTAYRWVAKGKFSIDGLLQITELWIDKGKIVERKIAQLFKISIDK